MIVAYFLGHPVYTQMRHAVLFTEITQTELNTPGYLRCVPQTDIYSNLSQSADLQVCRFILFVKQKAFVDMIPLINRLNTWCISIFLQQTETESNRF